MGTSISVTLFLFLFKNLLWIHANPEVKLEDLLKTVFLHVLICDRM